MPFSLSYIAIFSFSSSSTCTASCGGGDDVGTKLRARKSRWQDALCKSLDRIDCLCVVHLPQEWAFPDCRMRNVDERAHEMQIRYLRERELMTLLGAPFRMQMSGAQCPVDVLVEKVRAPMFSRALEGGEQELSISEIQVAVVGVPRARRVPVLQPVQADGVSVE